MSEADKIIESLKNSGKKVEEFYMSNKTRDKNVANIQDDVKIVKEFIDYAQGIIEDMEYERPVDVTVYQKELTSMTNILAERELKNKRIQELEEENKHLSNVSDYETISLECVHLEEKLEIANSRIQELEKERDHWHGCFIVAMENGIAKEKVKNVLKNNRNEIFSATYLSREQFRPYEMQIERINKIEQELIGEDK